MTNVSKTHEMCPMVESDVPAAIVFKPRRSVFLQLRYTRSTGVSQRPAEKRSRLKLISPVHYSLPYSAIAGHTKEIVTLSGQKHIADSKCSDLFLRARRLCPCSCGIPAEFRLRSVSQSINKVGTGMI